MRVRVSPTAPKIEHFFVAKCKIFKWNFFKKIKEVVEKKVNSNITFIEFYKKYNVKLNLFSTSLTQRKNICFNIETYPNLNVLKVLQASCSIPFIFPPVIINNEYYIDGCMKSLDGVQKNTIINDNNIHFSFMNNLDSDEIINDDGISHMIEGGLALKIQYEMLQNSSCRIFAKIV